MADTTIQKQGEVFISQSEYDALRLAGNLQSNTKYHITKTPETATEDFVNNGFVAKITPPDQFVYVYGYSENTPVLLKATSSATANQLAYRGTGGVLSVGKPTADNHATPKSYVDGLHHYTHIISLVGESSTIYITIAAKGYPNPITEIDDAGTTPSLSDLLSFAGQSSKAMATGLVTDLDGNKGTVVALWPDNGSVMVDYIVNGTISSNSVLALGTYTITDIVA